ncbi:hypothetical protein [Novacetimonas hansenii]|uniref:hypothetical protein n=1 Tax=Novacetimonas hansenii TaxID=436 RepID=UPI0015BF79F9|nr:hypothetical protein [Novacetimonas hansenii]
MTILRTPTLRTPRHDGAQGQARTPGRRRVAASLRPVALLLCLVSLAGCYGGRDWHDHHHHRDGYYGGGYHDGRGGYGRGGYGGGGYGGGGRGW